MTTAESREPVLITADDYGASAGINASIEALARAGRLSAVSVMAHGSADLSSIGRLVDAGVEVGLHLCLTRERPLLPMRFRSDARLPSSYLRLFAEIARRPSLVSHLAEESGAQAARLERAGVTITFINGHEHVHLFPPLWPATVALARGLQVRAVRAALGQRLDLSAAGALAAASRASWTISPFDEALVLSPLGVGRAGDLSLGAIDELIGRPFAAGRLRARELCVHPSLDARAGGRRAEHELLASGEVDRLLARRGFDRLRGPSALDPLTRASSCEYVWRPKDGASRAGRATNLGRSGPF